LQIWSEARRYLPGIREDENFATPQRSKSARTAGIRRLDLNLLGHQRLKWLIALGLVILHRGSSEPRRLSATAARNELAACFHGLIDLAVVIDRWGRPVVS
jgi:hypothetical protein